MWNLFKNNNNNIKNNDELQGGAVVTTVTAHLEGPGFQSTGQQGAFLCVHVCVFPLNCP